MSVEELVSQARDLWDALTQKRVTDYRGLVKAVHAGKKVKPEAIVEILDAVRKTPKDLEADLALAKQRDEWKAMDAQGPVDSARTSEINRQKDEIEKELNRRIRELEAAAKAKLDQLNAESQEIFARHVMRSRVSPRAMLVETSSMFEEVAAVADAFPAGGIPIPGTRDYRNISAKERERESCVQEVRSIERQIAEAKARRSSDPLESLSGFSYRQDGEIATLGKQLAEAQEKLQNAEADLSKLNAEIAAHGARLQKVEALALAE